MNYQSRSHASDANSVLSGRIKALLAKLGDPYKVARALKEEDGCDLECDGSGYVTVIKGNERCHYPLGITVLQ